VRSGMTSRILAHVAKDDNRWLLTRVVVPGLVIVVLAAGLLLSPLGRGLSGQLPAVLTFIGVLVTSAGATWILDALEVDSTDIPVDMHAQARSRQPRPAGCRAT
jgi:hypothetical protein